METEQNLEPPSENNSNRLVINATIMYGAMAAIGAMVCIYRHGGLLRSLEIALEPMAIAKLVAVALLGGGVLLVSNFLFEDLFPSYKNLKWALAKLMGGFSVPVAVYLAIVSAIGEELLFRGAIQAEVGIVATSMLFGLLHLGPGGYISSWTVWTGLAGLLLGWMCQATGNLWPSILSHFIVNVVSFMRLRALHKSTLTQKVMPLPEESSHL